MTLTEFIAAYSAIVSTAVASWQVYARMSEGPRLKVTCNPNMRMGGGSIQDDNDYIVVNATNTGNRSTTIQGVGMHAFANRWKRFRRKPEMSWVVNTSPPGNVVPHVLEPGHNFMTLALQNEEVRKTSREKLMYMTVWHSMGKREILVRLRPISDAKSETI
jgi:hypothetical protein